MVRYAITLFEDRHFLVKQGLKLCLVFRRHGKSDVCLALGIDSIESSLRQMLFHRREVAPTDAVEMKQPLGQFAIAHSFSRQQGTHNILVAAADDEAGRIILVKFAALLVQLLAESERPDVIEEIHHRQRLGNLAFTVQKGIQVLEHTAGGTRGWHKFGYPVVFTIFLPRGHRLGLLLVRNKLNAVVQGSRALDMKKRKTFAETVQLFLQLLFAQAFFFQLF